MDPDSHLEMNGAGKGEKLEVNIREALNMSYSHVSLNFLSLEELLSPQGQTLVSWIPTTWGPVN